MQINFLEELVAEWYEYKGYFVSRNERVDKRIEGGYNSELDIIAFKLDENKVIHIETSTDADSWENREKRFNKKFEAGRKYIQSLFKGIKPPDQIEQIAILDACSDKNHKTIGDGTIKLAEDFLIEIINEIKSKPSAKQAIPEKFPMLRLLQMISEHRKEVIKELN